MRYSLFIFVVSVFLLSSFSVAFAQETSSPATFVSPCQAGQSKEECAIENLNQGLLPPEQASESADPEVSSWLTIIGQTLSNALAFLTGANNLQDSYVAPTPQPEVTNTEQKPEEQKEGILQTIIKTLAGSEGYYGSTLPKAEELPAEFKKPEGEGLQIGPVKIDLLKAVNQEEKYFCNAYIPQEVCKADGSCEKIECPITGQPNQ